MSSTQQRSLGFGALEGLCLVTLGVWGCEVLGLWAGFGDSCLDSLGVCRDFGGMENCMEDEMGSQHIGICRVWGGWGAFGVWACTFEMYNSSC